MRNLGIDLSLRSTGCCFIYDDKTYFKLIQPGREYDNEELLIHISDTILDWIKQFDYKGMLPNNINIEGLSYNSMSGKKDLLAGNFWFVRTNLFLTYGKYCKINIVPVKSWREPLFNKEERKEIREANIGIKKLADEMKGKSLIERKASAMANEQLIRKASVKEQTFLKLPIDIQTSILEDHKKGKYDLADAYFICKYEAK